MNASHANITTQSSGLMGRRRARKHIKPRSQKPSSRARKYKLAATCRGMAALHRSRLYGLSRAAAANLKHNAKTAQPDLKTCESKFDGTETHPPPSDSDCGVRSGPQCASRRQAGWGRKQLESNTWQRNHARL